MLEHVHKMTRLNVGPPKRYACEVAGCGYEEPVVKTVQVEAPGRVDTTVAAAVGEFKATPKTIPAKRVVDRAVVVDNE